VPGVREFDQGLGELATVLTRLRVEGREPDVLKVPQVVYVDDEQRIHSDLGCWDASTRRLLTVDEVFDPTQKTAMACRCECGGWRGTTQAVSLVRAKVMFEVVDRVWAPALSGSFSAAARLFELLRDENMAAAGLPDLHQEMVAAAGEQLAALRTRLDVSEMMEAVAAHGVAVPVRANQGQLLSRWATEKTIESRRPHWSPASASHDWLADLFDPMLRDQLASSPCRRFLVTVPPVSTTHLLLWVSGATVVEAPHPVATRSSGPTSLTRPRSTSPIRSQTVVADAVLPEVVAEGLQALRGDAVPLRDDDDPLMAATVFALLATTARHRVGLVEVVEAARSLLA